MGLQLAQQGDEIDTPPTRGKAVSRLTDQGWFSIKENSPTWAPPRPPAVYIPAVGGDFLRSPHDGNTGRTRE